MITDLLATGTDPSERSIEDGVSNTIKDGEKGPERGQMG